jgi:hypothetical protein
MSQKRLVLAAIAETTKTIEKGYLGNFKVFVLA